MKRLLEPLLGFYRPIMLVMVCAIVGVAFLGGACSETDFNRGLVLKASDRAHPIELHDQFGRSVALSEYGGKVVVLTFLYTSCLDVCPLVTGNLKKTYELLGNDVGQVRFLAVSVDPDRDTVQRAYDYSKQRDMLQKWAFLVGDQRELAPIWEAYYVDPTIARHSHEETRSNTIQSKLRANNGVESSSDTAVSKHEISHSTPVYLIDRHGLMRTMFTMPMDPKDIVHDIKLLLQ